MNPALLYKSPPSQEHNYEFKKLLIHTHSPRDTTPPLPPTSQAFENTREGTTQQDNHEWLRDAEECKTPVGQMREVSIGVSLVEPTEDN